MTVAPAKLSRARLQWGSGQMVWWMLGVEFCRHTQTHPPTLTSAPTNIHVVRQEKCACTEKKILDDPKENQEKKEKRKTSPGDPGFPGVDPESPVSLGSQNPKESLLGTRGIPREYPVSKGYPRDNAFENSW